MTPAIAVWRRAQWSNGSGANLAQADDDDYESMGATDMRAPTCLCRRQIEGVAIAGLSHYLILLRCCARQDGLQSHQGTNDILVANITAGTAMCLIPFVGMKTAALLAPNSDCEESYTIKLFSKLQGFVYRAYRRASINHPRNGLFHP